MQGTITSKETTVGADPTVVEPMNQSVTFTITFDNTVSFWEIGIDGSGSPYSEFEFRSIPTEISSTFPFHSPPPTPGAGETLNEYSGTYWNGHVAGGILHTLWLSFNSSFYFTDSAGNETRGGIYISHEYSDPPNTLAMKTSASLMAKLNSLMLAETLFGFTTRDSYNPIDIGEPSESLDYQGTAKITAINTIASGEGPVPEPASMLLFGSGLAGLAWYVRRRKETG